MIKTRFSELDALRGIAAMAVVFYHYTDRYRDLFGLKPSYFKIEYGYLGVHLFFIISGFVIFYTIENSKNAYDFISRRFTRIFPIYWVCVTFTFIITWLGDLPGRTSNVWEYLVNLTMLQTGFNIKSVDGVYWSLFCELMFYLLMAVSFKIVNSKRLVYFVVIWALLFVVNRIHDIKYVIVQVLNLDWAVYFISGIYFYKIIKGNSNLLTKLIPAFCLVLIIIFHEKPSELWFISSFFVIFYLFVFNKLKFIAIKPLLFLGNISYALYLVHQNMGYIVLRWLNDSFGLIPGMVVIPVTVSITVAWFLTKYIEKPLIAFFREKLTSVNFQMNMIRRMLP